MLRALRRSKSCSAKKASVLFYFIALMRADRALLWRAALLRWMTFLFTSESMSGCASLSAALASAFLPEATASETLRRAVRMRERSAMLRVRLVSARRAAFSADLVFATKNLQEPGSFEGRVVC